MAVYQQNFRTAADLSAQARAASDIAIASYFLNAYLPSVDNSSLDYSFDIDKAGLTDVAEYRAFDATPGYGKGDSSGRTLAGKLPPISRRYRVKEYEQLQLQIGGETLIGDKLDEYARKAGLAIAARVGLAQAEAVEYSRVTLHENGLDGIVDFKRDADFNVVAASLFSDVTVDPTDELISWVAAYVAKNGVPPAVTLVSQRILEALSRNKYVIAFTTGRSASSVDLPNRVSFPDVISYLGSFGVTGVSIFAGAIDKKLLLSDTKMFFLPASGQTVLDEGPLGTTEWGITAESIQPVYGIGASERPGIFSAAFDDNQPQGTDVLGTAVVLPALRNPNGVFVAQVLAS